MQGNMPFQKMVNVFEINATQEQIKEYKERF